MILLLVFAFLAGLVTILSPCIWPVLPIVLSSTVGGKKGYQRALGVTTGVVVSFTSFTLFISYLVHIFHFDSNILRLLAVVIILFLGLSMIIPSLSGKVEGILSNFLGRFGKKESGKSNDFIPGFFTGISLGIVWSPCAGPILATIATLAATGKVSIFVFILTFFYALGAAIPLFVIALGGRNFIAHARSLNKYTGKIQQIFGVLMILSALAIYTNYDQYLQLQLLSQFPELSVVINGFENTGVVQNQLDFLKGIKSPQSTNNGLFNAYMIAPDFVGITSWLNTSKPMSIKDLKGRVVLVDFWTYTCINCIRTLPFLTSWYDKYKKDGFVIIGVHTPEFEFEHKTSNVKDAVKRFNIHYPVAQDNNYATWNNYNNQYWPAEYLIDSNGIIRRTHFGEGEYDQMEKAIQTLLEEKGKKVATNLVSIEDATPSYTISPETYLGSARMQYYYPLGSLSNGIQKFQLSVDLNLNSFSFGGEWNITDEAAVTEKSSLLNYNFIASKVYIILRPNSQEEGVAKVYLDGKLIGTKDQGADVKGGIVKIDSDRLYNIVDLHGKVESHILRLEFNNQGIRAYTFTFG